MQRGRRRDGKLSLCRSVSAVNWPFWSAGNCLTSTIFDVGRRFDVRWIKMQQQDACLPFEKQTNTNKQTHLKKMDYVGLVLKWEERERSSSASQLLIHSSTSSWWNLNITDLPRPPWRHQQQVSEGRAQQWTLRSSPVKNVHPLYILQPASCPSDRYTLADKRTLLLAILKKKTGQTGRTKVSGEQLAQLASAHLKWGGGIILIEIPTSASLIQ